RARVLLAGLAPASVERDRRRDAGRADRAECEGDRVAAERGGAGGDRWDYKSVAPFPSPFVGEGGAHRRCATDEGSVSADRDPTPRFAFRHSRCEASALLSMNGWQRPPMPRPQAERVN